MEWFDWELDGCGFGEPLVDATDGALVPNYVVLPQTTKVEVVEDSSLDQAHEALDNILAGVVYLMSKYQGDPVVQEWLDGVEGFVGE